jgi:hypothetical protein
MRTFEINWESAMAVTYVKKEVNDEKLTIRLSPQLKYTVELLSRRRMNLRPPSSRKQSGTWP